MFYYIHTENGNTGMGCSEKQDAENMLADYQMIYDQNAWLEEEKPDE